MIITKKTAGKRKNNSTDYGYTLQELQAAGIKFKNDTEIESAEKAAAEKAGAFYSEKSIYVLKNGKTVFFLSFRAGEVLQEFEAVSKKAKDFKKIYVATYGALTKSDGVKWSIGKIMNLILSFFEAARLESVANKALRKITARLESIASV